MARFTAADYEREQQERKKQDDEELTRLAIESARQKAEWVRQQNEKAEQVVLLQAEREAEQKARQEARQEKQRMMTERSGYDSEFFASLAAARCDRRTDYSVIVGEKHSEFRHIIVEKIGKTSYRVKKIEFTLCHSMEECRLLARSNGWKLTEFGDIFDESQMTCRQ